MKKLTLTLLLVISALAGLRAQNQKPDVKYIPAEGTVSRPFSKAVRIGNMLYLSGQLGTNPQTGKLVEGGIIPETRQTLENIKTILDTNGSSMEKVIKCTCMLADIQEWEKMNSEYVKYFPKNKPARSAFGTNGLVFNARIEIECIAYVE